MMVSLLPPRLPRKFEGCREIDEVEAIEGPELAMLDLVKLAAVDVVVSR